MRAAIAASILVEGGMTSCISTAVREGKLETEKIKMELNKPKKRKKKLKQRLVTMLLMQYFPTSSIGINKH